MQKDDTWIVKIEKKLIMKEEAEASKWGKCHSGTIIPGLIEASVHYHENGLIPYGHNTSFRTFAT
ncbi:uncharacterized protein FFMR_15894 [Fusarium fujikuroi]|nr:uncharacterized protein FFMR_15894 [Fusarium fujikuroi]